MFRTRVTFTGGVAGGGVSTMYWLATPDSAGLLAVSDALETFWTALDPQIVTGTTVALEPQAEVVDVTTGNITSSMAIPTWSHASAGAGEVLPMSTQGLISWRTGDYIGGREVRGRTFVPRPSELANVNGVPVAAYLTVLNNAAAALAADTDAALCIYSRAKQASRDVISGTGWSQWANLRSRRD